MNSWRKALALFFGISGSSFSLGGAILTTNLEITDNSIMPLIHILLILTGILAVFLSAFIWKGKNWARKSILGILIIGFLCMVMLAVIDFNSSTNSVVEGIGNISFYISLLMVPIFLIYVLLREDVKNEFES
ncbi:MAG: hypothetical protein OEW89_02610 [Gammaproteobacteria bacterium]|nr:hypothetical protein [Gammaproteobacteria bacterium]